MQYNILVSGFGGQGIVAAGNAIAYAGMKDEKNVSMLPSYGPEMRGGAASCHVIISDSKISSPLVTKPDIALIMSVPAIDKYEGQIRQGGTLIVDSYQVKQKINREDIDIIKIPATKIATELGSSKFSNIIMIGAMMKKINVPSEKGMNEALKYLLKDKESLIPLEMEALNKGINFI